MGTVTRRIALPGDILDKLGKEKLIPGLMDNTQELFLFFLNLYIFFGF